jgi:hypothetical protein
MANGTNLSGRNRTRNPRVQNPIESRQNQLLQYGIGKDTQYNTDTPFGLKPPKTKLGEIGQGILGGIEKFGEFSADVLDFPQKLGESTVSYLTSPSEAAKQLKKAQLEAINQNIFDAEEAIGGGFSPDTLKNLQAKPSGPKADQLVIDAETSEKNKKATAEGEAIFDAKQQIRGAESDAFDKLFEQSMEDYLTNVRGVGPERRTKDLQEYKQEFAEATGIDISGEVDKSSALMALGLAMMQNRAGKGFNVGRILNEFGKAGEAALPKLEAAKKQARNDGIAAGKFALEARSADQAIDAANAEKAMVKDSYFIVPNRGGGVSGDIAGILGSEGRLERLNKYELNALMKDKDFASKFTILPGSTHAKVVEEALKTPDGTALWDDKVVTRNLIEGIDDPLFQIDLSYGKSGGSKQGQYVLRDAEQIQIAENALMKMAQDNERAKEKFIELGILTSAERNVFTYGVDKLNSLASAIGVKIGEKETETDTIIRILEKIAMQKAPEILGESGKTISDADRERVERIVGQLKAGGDIRTVRARIQDLFNDVILGAENDIRQGLVNLSRYSGKDYGLSSQNPLNEDEVAELAGYEQ